MIIRPTSLASLERALRRVPEEKRKVIVLVGRHLNEGSDQIARRLHRDWEEQGAVVVKIPKQWTPQYLWNRIDFERLLLREARALHDSIPSDSEVINFLHRSFGIPVVNFHSSGQRQRGIRFFTGPDAASNVQSHGLIERGELVETHPAELSVEYTHEAPLRVEVMPTVHRLRESYGFTVKRDLDPEYLAKPVASREILARFNRKSSEAAKFREILSHLASGLRKR